MKKSDKCVCFGLSLVTLHAVTHHPNPRVGDGAQHRRLAQLLVRPEPHNALNVDAGRGAAHGDDLGERQLVLAHRRGAERGARPHKPLPRQLTSTASTDVLGCRATRCTYTAGSWMALNGGGSFQVWVAAAVSPVSLQALRQGIIQPLQLWTAHFGSKAKEQPPYSKPFVVILLIFGLPSLIQASCSLVYFFEIICMSIWMRGCTLVMLSVFGPIAKGTKHYYIRKFKKKEMWEKPLLIQYEIERDKRMSCYDQYCGCMAYYGDSELRAKMKNEERIGKETRREMSTAAVVFTVLNAFGPTFIFMAMPLATFSIWSLNLYSHYGWGLNYLLAVRDTLGDRYDHFFETRLEFLFPDFFAFWNNLNITTIAGQLGLSILLDVVLLGLQMLPDWGCIGRGRIKVGDPYEAEEEGAEEEEAWAAKAATAAEEAEAAEEYAPDNEEEDDEEEEGAACSTCGGTHTSKSNAMLLCKGPGCKQAFHQQCLVPPLQRVPEGKWLCSTCS